jgi:hypothetical protein
MIFRAGAKPRPITDLIRQRDAEAAPLKPLSDIGLLAEEARAKLMEAAKIAEAEQMRAIHVEVTETRERVQECLAHLASWTARDGE